MGKGFSLSGFGVGVLMGALQLGGVHLPKAVLVALYAVAVLLIVAGLVVVVRRSRQHEASGSLSTPPGYRGRGRSQLITRDRSKVAGVDVDDDATVTTEDDSQITR
jgi:hypothetical protein